MLGHSGGSCRNYYGEKVIKVLGMRISDLGSGNEALGMAVRVYSKQ